MLTKLIVRNFKRFDRVEIELGSPVVFVGPNNCGKTSALQALSLWELAARRWFEKEGGRNAQSRERPGVAINRRDVLASPVPDAKALWRDLHVRESSVREGRQRTRNIRVDVILQGVAAGKEWTCGFEFDYQNPESLICRPVREVGFEDARISECRFAPVPEEARALRMAFLPPMSGLASQEDRLDAGSLRRRIGEGRTAEVLRNLCYRVAEPGEDPASPSESAGHWEKLRDLLHSLFGVQLHRPEYIPETGEIVMGYADDKGLRLDIALAGRGMQQALLLFSFLYTNPGSVLLLDEPDAHLEVLRQRQIYNRLLDVAAEQGCQIIAASHSEVVLNEAAGKHTVVGFIGRTPRRVDDRGSHLRKALTKYGYENYLLAEQRKWVLYVEGPTDLDILRTMATVLEHPAARVLQAPYVRYLHTNVPSVAFEHFRSVREAVADLSGVLVLDRLESALETMAGLDSHCWRRREIENYLCTEELLVRFARGAEDWDLFSDYESGRRETAMREAIQSIADSLVNLDRPHPWSPDCKVSDDFLEPLFKSYYKRLGLPNVMQKTNFHILARFLVREEIDPEVVRVLDLINATAMAACARTESVDA